MNGRTVLLTRRPLVGQLTADVRAWYLRRLIRTGNDHVRHLEASLRATHLDLEALRVKLADAER